MAVRWMYIVGMREKVVSGHFDVLVERMKMSMNKLLEVHGPHLAFPPDPPAKFLIHVSKESTTDPDGTLCDDTKSRCSSGSSGRTAVPHVFSFLTSAGKKNADVWTCVQAGMPTEQGSLAFGFKAYQQYQ